MDTTMFEHLREEEEEEEEVPWYRDPNQAHPFNLTRKISVGACISRAIYLGTKPTLFYDASKRERMPRHFVLWLCSPGMLIL